MTFVSLLFGSPRSALGLLLVAGAVAAQPAGGGPSSPTGSVGKIFADGLEKLGILFRGIGSLAGGPSAGAVWRVDVSTGNRRRIGDVDDLAWPVPSPDGAAILALRGRQVVRITIADGREDPVGAPASWRKLLGVHPNGTVLGFVDDDPRPRPALLAPDGARMELPPPADDKERARNGILLQEAREYADGVRLEVQDSERGQRGRDVFLIDGVGQRNLTDCGDDFCGQPSRSQDGVSVFYVRAPAP